MKRILVFTSFWIASLGLYAQEPAAFKYGFKLYNLFSYGDESTARNDTTNFTIIREEESEISFLHVAPAFMMASRQGRWHEFELTTLRAWSNNAVITELDTNLNVQVLGGNKFTGADIGLRYEYVYPLFNSAEKRVIPAIGFGGGMYFNYVHNSPALSSAFESSFFTLGMRFHLISRIMIKAGKRWVFDLNVPFSLGDFFYSRSHLNNPSLPAAQRSISTVGFESFYYLLVVRLGAGIRF